MRYLRPSYVLIIMVGLTPPVIAAEHKPLLPRPQRVQYASGSLALRTLGIRFGSSPSAEDRFAARELVRALKERTGMELPVWEDQGQGPAIILTRTGPVDPLPMPDEQPGPKSRESYHLQVTSNGAEIRGQSSAAVFYGVQTLRQLVEGEGEQAILPEVEIDDWPSLAYRGPMVDVGSEGVMSTEEEVKRQLDFLARWKTNQFYFYNEANIELRGYPLLNPTGRFTQDQVRRIVAYGRERHIDVIPCLELYGHLHDLFRIEKYSDLADFPHGGEFNPSNPKVMALLADWVDQFAELFPSPFGHIGFDETWAIEKAAKQQGAGATPAKLFIQQLNNVAHLFEQRGKRVMAWADIMVKYPEIVSQLPPSIIAVAWYYEAAPDPEYKRWLVPLAAKHVSHLVASGVHSWVEIVPDFGTTFENIDTLLAAGRKSNALGLINTVWTDDAQNLLRMGWAGMAYGSVAPWQSTPIDRKPFFPDYSSQMYSASIAGEVSQALAELTQSESALQKVVGQETMRGMWSNPFTPALLKSARENREDLHQTRMLAEEAEEHLYRALGSGGDAASLNSLLLGGAMLDYTAMKYLYAVEIAEAWKHAQQQKTPSNGLSDALGRGINEQDHSRIADLMDGITGLRDMYRVNWLAEHTPYRLGTALGRWDAEYEYWRQLQARLWSLAASYRAGEPLPSLESITQSGSH
jgi:hexosaminidase